jgi:hypothetical protein
VSALRRLGVPLGCRQLLGYLAWLVVYAAFAVIVGRVALALFAGRGGCP